MVRKVAIIGGGISGLSLAALLTEAGIEVDLYEKEAKCGGHALTIHLPNGEKVDVGFQIFNEQTYTLLWQLFQKLGVEMQDAPMGLSFCDENFEWGSFSAKWNFTYIFTVAMICLGWFKFNLDIHCFLNQEKSLIRFIRDSGNIWNLFTITFWYVIINKMFVKEAPRNASFADFLRYRAFPQPFVDHALKPLLSILWTQTADEFENFSANAVFEFFTNHGLANPFEDTIRWKTLKHRSEDYVSRLIDRCGDLLNVKVNSEIHDLQHQKDWTIDGISYDSVVFAVRPNIVLKILEAVQGVQKIEKILQMFEINRGQACLHSDPSVMPKNRDHWSSWNVRQRENEHILTYWESHIQHLKDQNVFFTLGDNTGIDPKLVFHEFVMEHPGFSVRCVEAQKKLIDVQGTNGLFFAGAYLQNGFHEDGIWSSHQVFPGILEYVKDKK